MLLTCVWAWVCFYSFCSSLSYSFQTLDSFSWFFDYLLYSLLSVLFDWNLEPLQVAIIILDVIDTILHILSHFYSFISLISGKFTFLSLLAYNLQLCSFCFQHSSTYIVCVFIYINNMEYFFNLYIFQNILSFLISRRTTIIIILDYIVYPH